MSIEVSKEGATAPGFVKKIERIARANQQLRRIENLDPAIIRYLTIGILSKDEISKLSVLEINGTEGSDGHQNTTNSTRLGSYDGRGSCQTCYQTNCPGHFGSITFGTPIFHPLYLNNKVIIKILSSVCRCGSPFLKKEDLDRKGISKLKGVKRLAEIAKASVDAKCMQSVGKGDKVKTCGGRSLVFDLSSSNAKEGGGLLFYYPGGKKDKDKSKGKDKSKQKTMDAREALEIFEMISDETARMLGFRDRTVPRRFIMEAMLVPPLQTRSPEVSKGSSRPNKLTTLLNNIITRNNQLICLITEKKEMERRLMEESLSEGDRSFSDPYLQSSKTKISCSYGYDSDRKGKRGTGIGDAVGLLFTAVNDYQSFISKLIQGKMALIRNNMISKRGRFCGRAVLSPDDTLALGEIKIPASWANRITKREVVTSSNIKELQYLLDIGRVTHVESSSGILTGATREVIPGVKITLMPGDTVQRWLKNGDIMILDRQPTLHLQNIMSYRIILDPTSATIKIPLSITECTGADFDGDEASCWAPQSDETTEEVIDVMYACKNIMSSHEGKPIIGLAYDSITAGYTLTDPRTRLHPSIFQDVFYNYKEDLSNLNLLRRLKSFGVHPLSGAALFSSLLKPDFNYSKGDVRIVNGILIHGHITKDHIAAKHRSIVQEIWTRYGWEEASRFITKATHMLRTFFDLYGHSVGMKDCFINEFKDENGKTINVEAQINEWLQEAETKYQQLDLDSTDPHKTSVREILAESIINEFSERVKNLTKKLDPDNRILMMSSEQSGAKGSTFNTVQIIFAIGQQYQEGKRILSTMTNRTRSSPYDRIGGAQSLKSAGLCAGSFTRGLDPEEFFKHSIGTRFSVVEKPLNVPKIGDLQRRYSKVAESIIIGLKGEVRGSREVIIQFLYGGSGFHVCSLMKVGDRSSFTDVSSLATDINASYGWARLTEQESEGKVHEKDVIISDKEGPVHTWIGEAPSTWTDENGRLLIHRDYFTSRKDLLKMYTEQDQIHKGFALQNRLQPRSFDDNDEKKPLYQFPQHPLWDESIFSSESYHISDYPHGLFSADEDYGDLIPLPPLDETSSIPDLGDFDLDTIAEVPIENEEGDDII